ncbi:MAG: DUF6101 family protein, partial [Devosiaceae bacterium]
VNRKAKGSIMMASTGAKRALAANERPNVGVPANLQHAADGCRDAVAHASSMPQRGRVDVRDRSVVVTARMGGAMILQRISLNAYAGVAAQLSSEDGEEASIALTLRHADPAYSITLATDLPLDDAVAVWRGWSDKLCVPLLLTEADGKESVVRDMLGATTVRETQPRRAKTLVGRRPSFAKRRGRR